MTMENTGSQFSDRANQKLHPKFMHGIMGARDNTRARAEKKIKYKLEILLVHTHLNSTTLQNAIL